MPVNPAAGPVVGDDLMASVAAFIAERYAEKIRMADLARHVNVSVRTLQNLFHAHCGESPLRALRRYRLTRLYALIQRKPWAPLRLLFDQCGLTGALADRNLFLEMYGCTVRELQHACRFNIPARSILAPPQAWSHLETYLPYSA